jgi:hypothetical protein
MGGTDARKASITLGPAIEVRPRTAQAARQGDCDKDGPCTSKGVGPLERHGPSSFSPTFQTATRRIAPTCRNDAAA